MHALEVMVPRVQQDTSLQGFVVRLMDSVEEVCSWWEGREPGTEGGEGKGYMSACQSVYATPLSLWVVHCNCWRFAGDTAAHICPRFLTLVRSFLVLNPTPPAWVAFFISDEERLQGPFHRL